MMRIYKYVLPITDELEVYTNEIEQILHVGQQNDPQSLTLWALVHPESGLGPVRFCIRGTGHPFNGKEGKYVGTVQAILGLVWHVFRSTE